MKKNEIALQERFTGIANKELKQELTAIVKATEMGKASTWIIAQGYANIIAGELFEEDFESEKEFADFMGVTKGYISQCKKAVAFITKEDSLFTANDITVGKAYILASLSDEEYYGFYNWCAVNDYDIPSMSDKGLKDMIKMYKAENEAVETEAEEIDENVSCETSEEAEELIEVMIQGHKCMIPLSTCIELVDAYSVE